MYSMIALLPMLYNLKMSGQYPISNPFRGIYAVVIIFFVFILTPGCGGKTVLSDDAVRIRNISDFVNGLKKLYEQDDEHLLSMFSPEYSESEKELKPAILRDFERFSSISLTLFIDRMEINNDNVNVSIHWNGTWKDADRIYREGGSMVLQTSYEGSIQINGIKGDSPFGISRMLQDK